MELLIALAALFIGIIIGWIIKPAGMSAAEAGRLREEKAAAEARFKFLNDGALVDKFKSISAELLDAQKKEVAAEQAKTVRPVAEQLEKLKTDFDLQIKEILKNSTENKVSFSEQMRVMMEQSGALQREAAGLANALKHKKQQGNWGEFQLEKIFEILGFTEGREYEKEVFSRDEDGAMRPDYVLNLPGNRRVIIDSKLSLESYIKYANADNDDDKRRHIKEFVMATKKHMDILGAKEYQNRLKDSQLDYVFMFMPLEHAYLAALEAEPDLYRHGFKNNIAACTPSLLFPMMRTVDTILKIDKRDKNIVEVMDMVNKLYEKYVGFTENFADVGKKITQANESYNDALKQLSTGSGNMSGWFDKIKKKSGIGSGKNIAVAFEGDDDE